MRLAQGAAVSTGHPSPPSRGDSPSGSAISSSPGFLPPPSGSAVLSDKELLRFAILTVLQHAELSGATRSELARNIWGKR